MNEYPILFSGPMVMAILAGGKTQTRRVVNRATCASMPGWLWNRLEWDDAKVPEGAPRTFADNGYLHVACRPHPKDPQTVDCWTRERVYPRWEVGDRLWVREGWQRIARGYSPPAVLYRATHRGDGPKEGWRPSIFMPRHLSRLTLEIVGVRVEHLQDITEADAIAEGFDYGCGCGCPVHPFSLAWDSLNSARGYSWEVNPWVWVIEFRRSCPGDVQAKQKETKL